MKRINDELQGSYDRYYTCPVCGKTFYCYAPSNWVYRRGKNLVMCGWNCCMEWERQEEEKKKDRKEKLSKKLSTIGKEVAYKRKETMKKKKENNDGN